MHSKTTLGAAWVCAAGIGLLLTAANLILGDLNQDEGWYLYAARLVSAGKMLYRDFAYTQGPLLPIVYAPFQKIFALTGLAGGRALTALFGWISALLAAGLAARLNPRSSRAAALLAFVLAAVNVYQSYFFTVVKTYALTAACLNAAFLCLHGALASGKRRLFWAAGAFLALSTAARTSAAAAGLAVALVLFFAGQRKIIPAASWLHLVGGGAVAGGVVFLPFIIGAPENFYFNVVAYHAARAGGGMLPALIYKAGFISRLLQAYFPAFVLAVCAAGCAWKRPAGAVAAVGPTPAARLTAAAGWAGVAAVSLLHFLAPFPYDDYQVFVYPLFCALLAAAAMETLNDLLPAPIALAWLWLVIAAAAAFSSPLNQDWFIQGRELIWWKIKDKPPLLKLHETGRQLAAMTSPDDVILTQDPYLAVAANRRLPPGMELGQFCYFPDLTDEQARRYRVLNHTLMLQLIRDCPAPVAALSGYAFAMTAPRILPLAPERQKELFSAVESRYKLRQIVPHFGQAGTTLRIFTLKNNLDQPTP